MLGSRIDVPIVVFAGGIVGSLRSALGFGVLVEVGVALDGRHPCGEIRSLLKGVERLEPPFESILHQILGVVGIVGQHDGHGGDATTLAFVENAVHAFDWHTMCRNATILHRHQSNVVGTSLHGFDGLIVFDQRIDLLDYHCRFSLCLYGLMDV